MVKIVKTRGKEFTNSNGEVKHYVNFYVELENGQRVQVKPIWKEGYTVLNAIADEVDNM